MCPECGSNPRLVLVLVILGFFGVILLMHQNHGVITHQNNQITQLKSDLRMAKSSRGEPFDSAGLPDGPHFPRGNIIITKIANPQTGDKEYKFFWRPAITEKRMIWDSSLPGNPRITRYVKDGPVADYNEDKFDKLDKLALKMTREHTIDTMDDEGIIFKQGDNAILYQRDTGMG